jgi:hypothetical protein
VEGFEGTALHPRRGEAVHKLSLVLVHSTCNGSPTILGILLQKFPYVNERNEKKKVFETCSLKSSSIPAWPPIGPIGPL